MIIIHIHSFGNLPSPNLPSNTPRYTPYFLAPFSLSCRHNQFTQKYHKTRLLCLSSSSSSSSMAHNSEETKPISTIDQSKEVANGENVLAKHVAFFDRNNDGVVYPWETFKGFRAIGSGLLLSTVASFVINMGLSGKTRPGKFPNLLFPIEIKNIAKAKHGSDSGVYDTEGRFVPSKFEEIFTKHAHTHNGTALTSKELDEMLKANRQPKDFGGWFGAYIEWRILFFLCKDKNGLLQKDTIRGAYDGSLFEKMEMEKQAARKKR